MTNVSKVRQTFIANAVSIIENADDNLKVLLEVMNRGSGSLDAYIGSDLEKKFTDEFSKTKARKFKNNKQSRLYLYGLINGSLSSPKCDWSINRMKGDDAAHKADIADKKKQSEDKVKRKRRTKEEMEQANIKVSEIFKAAAEKFVNSKGDIDTFKEAQSEAEKLITKANSIKRRKEYRAAADTVVDKIKQEQAAKREQANKTQQQRASEKADKQQAQAKAHQTKAKSKVMNFKELVELFDDFLIWDDEENIQLFGCTPADLTTLDYKKLIQISHPDKGGDEEMHKLINEQYFKFKAAEKAKAAA